MTPTCSAYGNLNEKDYKADQEFHRRCGVMTRRQALAVGTVWILMAASPLLAHHTWAVDRSHAVTVKGTITGVNWSNPHVEVFVDAKDDTGNVEKWTVGGPSPSRMTGSGFNRNVLKPGTVITAVGYRATDGTRLLRTETIALSDGQTLAFYGNR
jgi:uncharacterized protein DUF6152